MLLGERLVYLRVVSKADVKAALGQQHLHGGRLGTHLVQLGALSVDELSTALGAHLGVPSVLESQFHAITDEVLASLSPRIAERFGVIPVAKRLSGTLVVAMVDPLQLGQLEELRVAVGAHLQACVAPELRIRYWLERLYGVRRAIHLLRADDGRAHEGADRRRRIPSVPPMQPGAQLLPPLGRTPGEAELPLTVEAEKRTPEGERAIAEIAAAGDGEAIAGAIGRYLARAPAGGLLLRVRPDVALVWRAAGPCDGPNAQRVAVPLSMPTAFRMAAETGKTFRGLPPEGGRAWHHELDQVLGVKEPDEICVVPVVVSGRPLALIYAPSRPLYDLPDEVVADLEGIAEAVARAVTRRFARS